MSQNVGNCLCYIDLKILRSTIFSPAAGEYLIRGSIASLPLLLFKGSIIEVEFEEVVVTGVAMIIGVRGCVGESGSNASNRRV